MIVGDANLSEVATFLKVGVTALVLAMIEDDFHAGSGPDARADPWRRFGPVSRDTTLRTTLELASGDTLTALELQWELYDLARKYAAERGLEALGSEEVGPPSARSLGGGPAAASRAIRSRLAGQLDWVAKLRLVEAYQERHGLDWDDPRLAGIDLQYHDLRPAKSLFARLTMERLSRRRGGRPGDHGATGDHAGVLPRPLPRALLVGDRRGQLGLGRLRHRGGSRCAACR